MFLPASADVICQSSLGTRATSALSVLSNNGFHGEILRCPIWVGADDPRSAFCQKQTCPA